MSILLETLNQDESSDEKAKSKADSSIPDIHASHYDDEMLGDEWLYKKLKYWQLATYSLVVLLLTSWSYFYSNQISVPTKKVLVQTVNQAPGVATETMEAIAKTEPQNKPEVPLTDNRVEIKESNKTNLQYVPKKREAKIENKQAFLVETVEPAKEAVQNSVSVLLEELPLQLQQQFPQININSYVVSNNEQDSFVILDGSFFKANQTIMPDLILRKINKENMLIEFHSYLVKIPFNQ